MVEEEYITKESNEIRIGKRIAEFAVILL